MLLHPELVFAVAEIVSGGELVRLGAPEFSCLLLNVDAAHLFLQPSLPKVFFPCYAAHLIGCFAG
jgi:hypothetical protein